MKEKKIFINTVPHSGTHFLSSLLENIGYEHAIFKHTFYYGKPFYRRIQKAGINWRTAKLLKEKIKVFEKKNVPVSVSAPVKITKSTYASLFKALSPGQFIIGHVPFSIEAQNAQKKYVDISITIIRDPRDMIFSMIRHIKERRQHHGFNYLFNVLTNDTDRFFAIAEGYENSFGKMIGVEEMLISMLNWQTNKSNICVRFEDIIGKKGGGESYLQLKTMNTLLSFIGQNLSNENLEKLVEETFGKSSTFRKGQIYGWKDVLNNENNEKFERRFHDLLAKTGYSSL